MLTSGDSPIAGLSVRIPGTGLSTSSDERGDWELMGIREEWTTEGAVPVVFDSATGYPSSTFRLRMNVEVTLDATRELPFPINIPMAVPGSETLLHGASTQTVLSPDFPGASLTVPPGCASFEDACGGSEMPESLSLVHIPRHQLPGPMPDGMTSDVVFSIQPSGVRFSEPVPVTFPNLDGFRPGDRVPIMQVHPDSGEWVEVGRATVNASGTVIASDPGSGVLWGSCTGCCYPPCRGDIAGRVTRRELVRGTEDTFEELPVPGARVTAGGVSTTTDFEGDYLLEDVAIGNCAQSSGPFEVVVTAQLPDGSRLQRKTVEISNMESVNVDFLFEGLAMIFMDDENDGQKLLTVGASRPRIAGGEAGEVHTVTADGATSVRLEFSTAVASTEVGDDLHLRVHIDRQASLPQAGDLGHLTVDDEARDGQVGDLLREFDWVPFSEVLQGAAGGGKDIRLVAPETFGEGFAIPDHEGRRYRTLAVRAEVARRSEAGMEVLFATFEPVELTVIRPQLFFVHGILNNRTKWALEAGAETATPESQTGLLVCTDLFRPAGLQNLLARGRRNFRMALQETMGHTPYELYTASYERFNMQSLDEGLPTVYGQLVQLEEYLRGRGIATTRFDVIGHSYGGLHARNIIDKTRAEAERDPTVAQKVRRLATLGTPHLGATASDRAVNFASFRLDGHRVPGAEEAFDCFRSYIDDQGIYQACAYCANHLAALDEMLRDGLAATTAHNELATRFRMQDRFRDWGFVQGVDYGFFAGNVTELERRGEDWFYDRGASLIGNKAARPCDLVVTVASAGAGSRARPLVPQSNHSEVAGLTNVLRAYAWLNEDGSNAGPPLQDPRADGPVIQIVTSLHVDTYVFGPSGRIDAPYEFEIFGANFASGGGPPVVTFPTSFGGTAEKVMRDGFWGDGYLRFHHRDNPLPDESSLRSGYVHVTVGGRDSNAVYLVINTPPPPPVVFPPSIVTPGGELVVATDHSTPVLLDPRFRFDGLFAEGRVVDTVSNPAGGWTSSVSVLVPVGAATGNLYLRDGLGAESTGVAFVVQPTVGAVDPADACIGQVVRIRGTGFGVRAAEVQVTIGSVPQTVLWANATEIGFVVADGTPASGIEVAVSGIPADGVVGLGVGADQDRDAMPDEWELLHGLDPADPRDALEDADDDGLVNRLEYARGTDPNASDTDGGGLADGLEDQLGLDPRDPLDDAGDPDGDGLSTVAELALGTDPSRADTDGDEVGDGSEVTGTFGFVLDPLRWDTDEDGLSDGEELFVHLTNPTDPDTDGDGLLDGSEVSGEAGAPTDPTEADTDGDGLDDGTELLVLGTDPTRTDTDGDGLDDGDELALGTAPTLADTDGDGLDDGLEVALMTDPTRSDPLTRLEGRVLAPDDGPAVGARVRPRGLDVARFSVLAGPQGDFAIEGWPQTLSPISVSVSWTDPSGLVARLDSDPVVVTGEVTSVGTLRLSALSTGSGVTYPLAILDRLDSVADVVSLDLDGDALPDLAVVGIGRTVEGTRGMLHVYRNEGNHGFRLGASQELPGLPRAVAAGDLDGGTATDLAIAFEEDDLVTLHRGEGGAFHAFDQLVVDGPREIVVGELDGIRPAELLVSNRTEILVSQDLGLGSFEVPVSVEYLGWEPLGLALVDMDRSGTLDLLYAGGTFFSRELRVQRGDGMGGFSDPETTALDSQPEDLVVAELDGGVFPDVAVLFDDEVDVFSNDGLSLTFIAKVGTSPGSVAVTGADLDGDGASELLVANASLKEGHVLVLNNRSAGLFWSTRRIELANSVVEDLLLLDLENEGRSDLLLLDPEAGDLLLLPADREAAGSFQKPSYLDAGVDVVTFVVDDFDGDAAPDLMMIVFGTLDEILRGVLGKLLVAPGDGLGGLGSARLVRELATLPLVIEAVDVNGDGLPEVRFPVEGGQMLLRNDGDFLFGAELVLPVHDRGSLTLVAPHGLVDLDGDGDLDHLGFQQGDGASKIDVRRNRDGWSFDSPRSLAVPGEVHSVAGVQLDGVGLLDIAFLSNMENGSRMQVGEMLGTGSFEWGPAALTTVQDGGVSVPLGLGGLDANADGLGDVVLLYLVDEDYRFPSVPDLHTRLVLLPGVAGGFGSLVTLDEGGRDQTFLDLKVLDVNGDGRQDLILSRAGQGLSIFVNAGAGLADPRRYTGDFVFGTVHQATGGDRLPDLGSEIGPGRIRILPNLSGR